jgi:hypothetical protein
VKRKARGYRTVEYMTSLLYFVAGKLTLPCYGPTENSDEPPFSEATSQVLLLCGVLQSSIEA